MQLKVRRSSVNGSLYASPSKSYTHRALVLAALAEGRSRLHRPLLSGDCLATLDAIQELGAQVKRCGDALLVEGGKLHCPEKAIDCQNSGTTLRILAGVTSLLPCTTVLTGDASLQRRPMGPLIDALQELGVGCRSQNDNGMAPLEVTGPNRGKVTHIRGDVSSQFISSLLISSALKEVDTDIILTTPLKSRPYVEITLEMMERFGARCSPSAEGFHVPGSQKYRAQDYVVPGDYSSAAFPLVAGALTGRVEVRGLDPLDRQGDKVVLDILQGFGSPVRRVDEGVVVHRNHLVANEVDLADSPDLFPIVAVLATQAEGETIIRNAEHVRHKESDRIRASTEFLQRMGAEVEERADGCVIKGPSPLKGAMVDSLGDHRILMAAAVAGLVAEGETTISEGDCFKISYPSFLADMRSLGAGLELTE